MELETFFEQFELLADAPTGVQKLRGLILQLAVQGKLVPQDPKDEPASVLLGRIKVEVARLIKEGKIKKGKELSPVDVNEVSRDLPQGWVWTRLGTIGEINPRNVCQDNLEVSFVPMNLIPQSYGDALESETKKWGDVKKGYTHFADGDVVVAKITPCFENGKAAVMENLKNRLGAGTTELHVFRPIDKLINPSYILLHFKSPDFVNNGISKFTGTAGQKRLPKDYFAENPFPLPPLSEQHRIVAKVDRLMALCDELEARQEKQHKRISQLGKVATSQLLTPSTPEAFNQHWQGICANFDLLYSTSENVSQLRQAILQLAVMGKLVPQDPNDEPASVLLERIKEEKARLVKEGKIKKEEEFPPVDTSKMPYVLPRGWEWMRLGQTAKVIEYGTSYKSLPMGEEVPIFRMNNIQSGQITFDNLKYVPKSIKDLPRLYLENGDLLFNRTNSYELVGKTGIFKGESNKYTFASYLIRISIFYDFVNSEFVNMAMNSGYFRHTQIEPEITQQCGQANFNGTKLKNALIPLPPLPEQYRIVAKVDQLMSLCDELEAKLKQSINNREKLMETAARQVLMA